MKAHYTITGLSYETEGESLALRDEQFVDAIGMSTAPEVVIAKNRGINIVGMSYITNIIGADDTNATNHKEVKKILESTEVKNRLTTTIKKFFALYQKQMK